MNTFDRDVSLRIDAMLKAIDFVQTWPDSCAKQMCMAVLQKRLRALEQQVPA